MVILENSFFNETVSYDENSNIVSLQRNGLPNEGFPAQIDNLSYQYYPNSDRLKSITDTSFNYSGYPDESGNTINYDSNGNMIDHIDKGINKI